MTVRVVLNQAGIRELLKSPGVRADIQTRADRVAAQAGPGNIAGVDETPSRVRGYVVTATPDAQHAEATGRTLTRAIDAGR